MHTAYIAAVATLCSWTISTFVLAKLSRLTRPAILNKASLFFSIILLGAVVCVMDGLAPWQLFTKPAGANWLWLGLSGILGKSLGDYCGFTCLRILGARRRSMLTTLTPGFTWLFGIIIIQERLNAVGIVAIMITSVSLLLLLNSNAEKEEVNRENFGEPWKGLLFGITAAVLTALAYVFSKESYLVTGHSISEFHATWIRVIVAFAAIWLFDLPFRRNASFVKEFITTRQKGILMFWAILFGTILGLSFSLMAIDRMNVAAAYTIFSLVPVLVIIVSVLFYKKKIHWLSWIYSFIAIAGVLMLIWRDKLIKLL